MLRSLFVLIILVPGIVAAARNRFAALLLYLWFALFRPQEWLWVDITSLRLSLVLSLLLVVPWNWFVSGWVSKELREQYAREALPTVTHPLSIGILLFLGTALIAHLQAFNPPLSLMWLDFMWRLVLVTTVMITLVSSTTRFWVVVLVIGASIGFHATKAGISSILGGGVRYQMGLGGAFEDSNAYALVIVTIQPFLVAIGQTTDRRWLRWLCYGCIVPSSYTIISTFSRAGFLAFLASLGAFAAVQRRRFAIVLSLVAIGVVAALAAPVPEGYFDRMQTIRTYEQVGEESAISRLHFWRVAIEMVRARPLGVGMRNYDAAYDSYDFSQGRFGTKRAVHSSHFQVLAEEGYAGAAIWLGLFGYAALLCVRIRSRSRHPALSAWDQNFYFAMSNAMLVSMTGFAVGGAFIASALNDLTWLTFGLVAALDRLSLKSLEAGSPAPAPTVPTPAHEPSLAQEPPPVFRGGYRSTGALTMAGRIGRGPR